VTSPIDSSFTIALAVAPISFNAEEGTAVPPARLLGTISGTQPPALYTGGDDLGTAIDRVAVEVVGTQFTVNVFAKSNLAPGTYSGSLKLYACPDPLCAKNFAGSPATVPYTVTITRGFKVTPSSFSLTALSGASASADVAVQGPDGQTFTAQPVNDWLKVSKVGTNGFTLTAGSMPPGDYVGHVTVSSGGRTRDVSVSYAVTTDQSTVTRIIPSVDSLSFTALTTTATAAQTVNVTLPSWTTELDATLRYLGPANGWLTMTRTGDRSYAFTASAASLAAGTYSAELVLSSASPARPVVVPVTFSVGAASWSVVGARSFTVNRDTTAAQLNAAVVLDIPGLQPQQWSASSNAAWLALTQATGTTGTAGTAQLKAAVDLAELRKLPNFAAYTAEATVRSANPLIAPLKLAFTLDKAVPELHYVSPATRLPGEAGDFTLRGQGFNGIAQIGQALQVNGATPLAVTLVSDTELTVRLAGAANGTVSFAIANQLGMASATPELKVAAPVAYGYQALPTAGRKGGLVFDPQRQALYTANATLGSVMRFSYDGSKWNTDSVALPGADMVALAPDGKQLVATSATSSSIVLLDPATLATLGSYQASAVGSGGPYIAPRLAVMNDGRAFFQGGVWSGSLPYFDIFSRTFGSIAGSFTFYDGPWFNVSGDGAHMLIVQSAGISPSPPMLYMNSTDNAPKVNPAGLKFWYDAAQSLHGERFVEDSFRVWDRDFALIGNLAIPAASNYYGKTTVLSPDGSRAYVLAYSARTVSGSASDLPRVYVFDTSTRMVSSTDVPLLGYFTLADTPSCARSDYSCVDSLRGAISPDGKTLFFIGDVKLVVTPVPALTASPTGSAVPTRLRLTVPRR
jgi:hypothetical protein